MSGTTTRTSVDLDARRRNYVANLGALYAADAEVACALEAVAFAEIPPLEQAKDGSATVRVTADDGAIVYAHSKYRPADEAEKLLDSLPAAEQPTFFVTGMGLGYVVRALEGRYDRPLVIVAEDDVALLKAALCLHDCAAMIREGRLVLLTAADKAVLHRKLLPRNADVMLGFQMVAPPLAKRYHAEFHEQVRALLTDFVSYTKTQMVTLLKTARTSFRNVALNLPAYLDQPGIEALKNKAAGYPAIIVAAGPSLARNLEQLGPLRDRAVIIAVQTVFKLLNALSVRPHFVTCIDFHEISAEFFRGLPDVGDCRLVADGKATWVVPDGYPGDRYILHHRFLDSLVRDGGVRHGELRAGTTVAHLSFYLAEHLGCDPIAFVGQDLAFSEGMFYLPGSPIEQIWRPELGRFQTVEMKQWERIVRNRPILRSIRDVHGRPTYTDDLLFAYREQFHNDIAASAARVIQASEGGAELAGAEVLPLADVARQFCTRELPAELFDVPHARLDGDAWQRQAAEIEARVADTRKLKAIAAEMIELLTKLEQLIERPSEFNRLIVRVDDLRTSIQSFDVLFNLVADVAPSATLKRYGADRRLGTVERETAETARRRLARDRDFVEAFADGCDFLLSVLPEALERLRGRVS